MCRVLFMCFIFFLQKIANTEFIVHLHVWTSAALVRRNTPCHLFCPQLRKPMRIGPRIYHLNVWHKSYYIRIRNVCPSFLRRLEYFFVAHQLILMTIPSWHASYWYEKILRFFKLFIFWRFSCVFFSQQDFFCLFSCEMKFKFYIFWSLMFPVLFVAFSQRYLSLYICFFPSQGCGD